LNRTLSIVSNSASSVYSVLSPLTNRFRRKLLNFSLSPFSEHSQSLSFTFLFFFVHSTFISGVRRNQQDCSKIIKNHPSFFLNKVVPICKSRFSLFLCLFFRFLSFFIFPLLLSFLSLIILPFYYFFIVMDHEINMVSDISGVGVGAVQKISGSWLSSGSDWARANLARPKMTRANLAR
jgi:hypothetical protein